MEEKSGNCCQCGRTFFSLSDEPDYRYITISDRCEHCYNNQDPKTDEEIEEQNWELKQEQDDDFLK